MQTKTEIELAATEKIIQAKQFFVISKKEAKKSIKILKMAIKQSTVLPILDFVVIDIDKLGVRMGATDLENYITVEPELISYSGEKSFCVHGKHLEWFFNKSLSEEIKIEIVGNDCVMTCDNFTVSVSTEKAESYPKKHTIEPKRNITIGKELISAMSAAIKYVSNDDLRPSMTGINLVSVKNELYIAATDAHRLFYRNLKTTVDDVLDIIISKRGSEIIYNTFKGDINLEIDANYIRIKTDNVELISRKIDSRYPNWQAVLPETPFSFTVNRKKLIEYFDIAQYFSNSYTKQVILSLNKNKLDILIDNVDWSIKSEFTIPIQSSNTEKHKAAFNALFMLTSLLTNGKNETVEIKHTGVATKAIIIDNEILVMPLMINN
jgi:DNA polymerase-3 subunit beta